MVTARAVAMTATALASAMYMASPWDTHDHIRRCKDESGPWVDADDNSLAQYWEQGGTMGQPTHYCMMYCI